MKIKDAWRRWDSRAVICLIAVVICGTPAFVEAQDTDIVSTCPDAFTVGKDAIVNCSVMVSDSCTPKKVSISFTGDAGTLTPPGGSAFPDCDTKWKDNTRCDSGAGGKGKYMYQFKLKFSKTAGTNDTIVCKADGCEKLSAKPCGPGLNVNGNNETDPKKAEEDEGGSSMGLILGISAAVAVLVVLVIIGALYLRKKKSIPQAGDNKRVSNASIKSGKKSGTSGTSGTSIGRRKSLRDSVAETASSAATTVSSTVSSTVASATSNKSSLDEASETETASVFSTQGSEK